MPLHNRSHITSAPPRLGKTPVLPTVNPPEPWAQGFWDYGTLLGVRWASYRPCPPLYAPDPHVEETSHRWGGPPLLLPAAPFRAPSSHHWPPRPASRASRAALSARQSEHLRGTPLQAWPATAHELIRAPDTSQSGPQMSRGPSHTEEEVRIHPGGPRKLARPAMPSGARGLPLESPSRPGRAAFKARQPPPLPSSSLHDPQAGRHAPRRAHP
jgi:hypothetical protein